MKYTPRDPLKDTNRTDRIIIAVVAVVVLVLVALMMTVKYNCCRDAGFDHDECVYSVACNG
jgi:hypothetical protein